MPGMTIDQAKDIGALTLKNIKTDKFEQVLEHNDYPILDRLYTGRDVDVTDGLLIERQISLGKTGNADHVSIYAERDQNIVNLTKKIQVPWCHADTSFSYAVQEIATQGSNKAIVKLLKLRKNNMWAEFADELEERAWSSPDNASDVDNPRGIPYWLTMPISYTVDGFVGLNPQYAEGGEITTGAGGLSSTTYGKWGNYYAGYTTGIDDAFIKKMSRAFRQSKFKSPTVVKDLTEGSLKNFKLFTNDYVIGEMEAFALKADDSVGYDIGKYAGLTTFKRMPLTYIDTLDTANAYTFGTNPIVGINFDFLEVVILNGDNFRLSPPEKAGIKQHNLLTVFCDLSYNYVSTNRRRLGFLLSDRS